MWYMDYILKKVYIIYNKQINDNPRKAFFLFWTYYFIYLSSLMVPLFIKIMYFNTKFCDIYGDKSLLNDKF